MLPCVYLPDIACLTISYVYFNALQIAPNLAMENVFTQLLGEEKVFIVMQFVILYFLNINDTGTLLVSTKGLYFLCFGILCNPCHKQQASELVK